MRLDIVGLGGVLNIFLSSPSTSLTHLAELFAGVVVVLNDIFGRVLEGLGVVVKPMPVKIGLRERRALATARRTGPHFVEAMRFARSSKVLRDGST